MKKTMVTMLLFLSALVVQAASTPTNLAGSWAFDSAQSNNVGMMSEAN